MRYIYDIFFLVFSIFYLPYLVIKKKAHKDFAQRLGFLPDEITGIERPVWIHAVSVGEAVLAAEVSRRLKNKYPGLKIAVSTTTESGNNIMRARGGDFVDGIFYFPLDLSGVVRRVVARINPSAFIMIETEIWPNLLMCLRENGIPAMLVNGRISDRSYKNYRSVKFLMRGILQNIDHFCMQTHKDAQRIGSLGAEIRRIEVTGNIKFDCCPDPAGVEVFSREQLGFGRNDHILVAGSTHYPEEQYIIEAYKQLKERYADLKLIIAPRHVERSGAIGIYIEKNKLKYLRFSEMDSVTRMGEEGPEILLVDSIGHLSGLYALASIIFIGGSLVRRGGQNPIEGARTGKPVIFGPFMYNFREISEMFLESGAAVMAGRKEQLPRIIDDLLTDAAKRELMGQRAARLVEENTGAVDRVIEIIKEQVQS